jgi:hypothetical protein
MVNPAKLFLRLLKESEKEPWKLPKEHYCTRGQPYFSEERKAELLAQAETERVLVEEAPDYSFVLLWDTWKRPTGIYWGLGRGPLFYVIRKGGEEIYRTQYKSHLLDEWRFITTGTRVVRPQREQSRKEKGVILEPLLEHSENLMLYVITTGDLYPRLQEIYVRCAERLLTEKADTIYDIWSEFMPVIETAEQGFLKILDAQRLYGHARLSVRTKRQVALRIAERFYVEWELNPQDFQRAA